LTILPPWAGLQKRQQDTRYFKWANNIRLICAAKSVPSYFAFEVITHAGIVDQNIETAKFLLEKSRKRGDVFRAGDIQLDRMHIQPLCPQFLRSLTRFPQRARTEHHGDSLFRELLRNLQPNAFVRTGNECHSLFAHSCNSRTRQRFHARR